MRYAKNEQPTNSGPTTGASQAQPAYAPDFHEQKKREEQERRTKEEQARKLKQERERARWHDEVAPIYARRAGDQIMNKVGGGQDMRVQVDSWRFNAYANRLVIEMTLSFNGFFNRNNYYQVSGTLTVDDQGRGPEFSRTHANEKFQKLERNLAILEGTAIILDELNRELSK